MGINVKVYKTAIYLRLSSGGGRDLEEDSITNQRIVIENYLKQFSEFEIVSEFVDEGVSGLIFERQAFTEMMCKAKQSEIDCIIVRDLSRFGRDYIETGRYLQTVLPLMGIRFISVLDHIDTISMSENQELMMKLKLLINDAYSRDISMKTRKSLTAMRDKGLYTGASPVYGYKKSEYDRHRLVIDENTAPVVKEIFSLKIQGYSLNKIMQKLNFRNIPSPLQYKKMNGLPFSNGGFVNTENPKWSANTILRILRDETYTGTLIQGKVTTINYKLPIPIHRSQEDVSSVANVHEAIISKNDFQLIQRMLAIKTRASPNTEIPHLLSGLVICGSCDNHMTIKTVRSNNKCYRYYYCPTGKKNGCLTPVMIRCEKLEQEVIAQIRNHVDEMAILRNKLNQMSDDELQKFFTADLYSKLDGLYFQKDKIEKNYRSLGKSLLDGVIDKDEYADLKVKYQNEINSFSIEIHNVQNQIAKVTDDIANKLLWLAEICKINRLQNLQRVDIIKVVEKILVGERTHIEIKLIDD